MMRLGSNPNYVACQEDAAGLETLDYLRRATPWVSSHSLPTSITRRTLAQRANPGTGGSNQRWARSGVAGIAHPWPQSFRGAADLHEVAQLISGQIGGALASALTLQTERRRADRIWSHSRDLIVVVDASGVFRSVNPAWTQILATLHKMSWDIILRTSWLPMMSEQAGRR
jgi:PAS domain-containing protein